MIDVFDMIHYLIGGFILGVLIWCIVQVDKHFGETDISFDPLKSMSIQNEL